MPSLNFEEARRLCIQKVAQPEDIACVQLVYGRAGWWTAHISWHVLDVTKRLRISHFILQCPILLSTCPFSFFPPIFHLTLLFLPSSFTFHFSFPLSCPFHFHPSSLFAFPFPFLFLLSLHFILFCFFPFPFSSPPSTFSFFFVLFFLYLFPYPLCRSLPFLFFLSALSFSFFLFPSNSFCLGDGKTHYIQQQLASSPASLTIAINEAFTPVNAISKLRSLPFSLKDCVIFFNFTMLPPGVRIGREGGKVDARLLVYKEIGFVKQTQL